MKQTIISLDNLKIFLTKVKDWVINYFKDNTDKVMSTTSENPIQNKVITDYVKHMIWQGTSEEYAIAYAAGEIREGTIINITDDYDELVLEQCTYEEIAALFA